MGFVWISALKDLRRQLATRVQERLTEVFIFSEQVLEVLWSGLRLLNLAEPAGDSPELARGFEVLRKGSLQLASKMRFVSAQLNAQLEDGLWREIADHSNSMARLLADGIEWTEGADLGQRPAEIERKVAHRGGQDAARRAARQVGEQAVALLHAAAVFRDQFIERDAGRRQMHARLVDPARHREAAQAVAVVATVAGEPVRASAVDLGYPVDGLDVVHQGRSIE